MMDITTNTSPDETALEDTVVMVAAIAVRGNMQRKNPAVETLSVFSLTDRSVGDNRRIMTDWSVNS
jgi:hypothetical protein